MFSPLNVVIRPSQNKRRLFLLVHLLALLSVCVAQIPLLVQFFLVIVLSLSAYQQWNSVEPTWSLHWDLDTPMLSVAKDGDPLEESRGIRQLYLVFGLLYLQINRGDKPRLQLLIFADSVDKHSYRKLRVAARWANLAPKSE